MKCAVIGHGNIGRVHRRVLEELGHVPVLCDSDETRRGGGYADWREMLARERPDVVHICTPHCLHADMVVGCLEAGAHVLCEKPLCIRREDIPRILEAERCAKGMLGVCLQNRYNPSSRYAAQFLRTRRVKSAAAMHSWHRDGAYYASGAWRGKWATEGGGVLINQALHTVDLIQWLAGMPERVAAQIGQLSLGGVIEAEDTAVLRMTAGDTVETLFATTGGGVDFPPVVFFETEDGARLELLPDAVRVNGESVPLEAPRAAYGKPCYGGSHRLLIEHFYQCAASGERFPVDGAEGARCVRIVLAAYESRGRTLAL